jgi:hypothetical protein
LQIKLPVITAYPENPVIVRRMFRLSTDFIVVWEGKMNQNAECSQKRNWIKLVLGLCILLKSLDALHRKLGFQVCYISERDFNT